MMVMMLMIIIIVIIMRTAIIFAGIKTTFSSSHSIHPIQFTRLFYWGLFAFATASRTNPSVKLDTFDTDMAMVLCFCLPLDLEKCWIQYIYFNGFTSIVNIFSLLLCCIASKFSDQPSIKKNIWYFYLEATKSWGLLFVFG